MDYKEYERRKTELQELNLTSQEYEQEIKKIVDELEGK